MGHTYSDIVETATMKPLTKERYEYLIKNAPFTGVTFKNASEQVVADMLAHPTVIVGSDAFPYTAKSDGSIVYDWDTPFDAVNGTIVVKDSKVLKDVFPGQPIRNPLLD